MEGSPTSVPGGAGIKPWIRRNAILERVVHLVRGNIYICIYLYIYVELQVDQAVDIFNFGCTAFACYAKVERVCSVQCTFHPSNSEHWEIPNSR